MSDNKQEHMEMIALPDKDFPVRVFEDALMSLYDKYIKGRFDELEEGISDIKAQLEEMSPFLAPDNGVELRDISYDQAKCEMADYFLKNDGREIGYEELIETLQLDPVRVVEICDELVREGKIG